MNLKNTFLRCLSNNYDTISIVSAIHTQRKYAFTISSFTSVSLDPESVLFCMNKANSFDIAEGRKISISFLNEDQIKLSEACSDPKKYEERFAFEGWEEEGKYIYNKNSRFALHCTVSNIIEKGTHYVVICDVNKILELYKDKQPLIYGNRNYAKIER